MTYLLYIYLAMMIFSGAAFLIGASKYLKPHKPLYASMIVLGIGCTAIGRLHSFLRVLTGLEVMDIFHVGLLGTFGTFMFFFSSNYGQIDSLVDDGSKEFLKYRLAGFIGVIVTAGLYVSVLLSPAPAAEAVTDGIVALAVAVASYFHVKHILIPDIDYGVVRCQRGYNILALLYGMLCMLEMVSVAYNIEILLIIVCVFQCAVSFFLVIALDRGVKKWSK